MDSRARRQLQRDVVLPLAADRARARLIRLFELETGRHQVELTVGPGRFGRIGTSRVAGVVTGPRPRLSTDTFSLHWEPIGVSRRTLPDLDAAFGVTPIDQTACLLSIVAEYGVPFRGVGVAADRAVMRRVADATLQALLREWARAINDSTSTLSGYPLRSVTT